MGPVMSFTPRKTQGLQPTSIPGTPFEHTNVAGYFILLVPMLFLVRFFQVKTEIKRKKTRAIEESHGETFESQR